MGLLDPNLFTNPVLLNQLKGLLGNMPIAQLMRGEAEVSREGLLGEMRKIPVFDPSVSDEFMGNAMNAMTPFGVLGTLKPVGGFKSARELVDAFEAQRGIDAYVSEGLGAGRPGLTLNKIKVPKAERGRGVGSEFMQDLIDYADQTGQRLYLSPSTDFGATSVDRLKRFYKRFGFVENKGRNKDFTTRETMFRREGGE